MGEPERDRPSPTDAEKESRRAGRKQAPPLPGTIGVYDRPRGLAALSRLTVTMIVMTIISIVLLLVFLFGSVPFYSLPG